MMQIRIMHIVDLLGVGGAEKGLVTLSQVGELRRQLGQNALWNNFIWS